MVAGSLLLHFGFWAWNLGSHRVSHHAAPIGELFKKAQCW